MLYFTEIAGYISISILFVFVNFFSADTYNVDTTSYGVLRSPKEDSYFGYSIAAANVNGNVTIWSGSPKYAEIEDINSTAKAGTIFSCSLSLSSGGDYEQICKKLNFKPDDKNKNKNNTLKNDNITADPRLPKTALRKCSFNNSICEYTADKRRLWLLGHQYKTRQITPLKYNTPNKFQYCHRDIATGKRLTGPPDFTVHEGMLAFNSDAAAGLTKKGGIASSTLSSQSIEAKAGITQCLRFCFNAFSIFDYNASDPTLQNESWYTGKARSLASVKARRSLQVFMKFENSTTKKLFEYIGPRDIASKYWNFTEINLKHTSDVIYELVFKVSVINQLLRPDCQGKKKCPKMCSAAADIVLTDITVDNSACEDQPVDVDELTGEQSIGMTMDIQLQDESNNPILTTCGSLWQQNCGYAKEATGICYEITGNTSQPKVIKNPGSTGCIRGKIDIVLLVDQSGSVNQCNFQKVKRWLRNIVRGFTIGPKDQDIGIVIYSSEEFTSNAFELGFEKYENSGEEKKKKMLEGLKELRYEAGTTYTGLAFKHANDLLWGPSARPDAKKMVILLTDGETSKQDQSRLHEQVNLTRSNNATILAVGVAKFNPAELISISGNSQNFFPVKDFSQLEQVRDTLRQSVSHSNLEGSKGSDSMQNCQMGFSIHREKDSLIMGSPGCYNRAGNVIKHEDAEDQVSDTTQNISMSDPSFHNNMTMNVTDTPETSSSSSSDGFFIPTRNELIRVFGENIDDSYLGYAVASGYFHGVDQGLYVASSAPRYGRAGAVLIYKPNHPQQLTDAHVLEGTQLGEYFGATLCSVDINNDEFDDLLVGAPLYTDQSADEGRVYVYMGATNMSSTPDYILEGSRQPFSRFGIIITSVGDITLDNYPDIVVSAPFEDDGQGAIYLFSGTSSGMHKEYTQRIVASSFNKSNVGLFGQSVTGSVDMDGNGYPDILVGTPGSDEIIVLKTRPVAQIDASFFITSPLIDRKDDNCWRQNTTSDENFSSNACISCTVCFSYHGLSIPPGIGIQYNISTDIGKANSRVGFYGTEDNGGKTMHGSTMLWEANTAKCLNHTLYLKNNIQDMMTKLTLELNFDMDEYKFNDTNSSSTENKLAPVLEISTVKSIPTTTFFKTYCEDTSSCVADISIAGSGPVNVDGTKLSTYEISAIKLMALQLDLENIGPEDAHAVTVTVKYPNAFIYSSITKTFCFEYSEESEIDDETNEVSFVLRKTFIGLNERCTGVLILLATPVVKPDVIDSVTFHINASTVSEDTNIIDNVKELTTPIVYKSSFILNGASYPPSISGFITNSTNSTEKVFAHFQHIYSITNTGPFSYQNVSVVLEWPTCTEQDEESYFVKYISHKVCNDQKQTSCTNKSTNRFLLRNNDSTVCTENYAGTCSSSSTTKCPTIEVNIDSLPANKYISIVFDGEVDLKQFKDLENQLSITTVLSIDMDYKSRFKFPSEQIFKRSIATTVYPPRVQDTVTEVKSFSTIPLWVYIISILAGLLMLLIILLFLKWRGFFESKYAKKKKDAQEELKDMTEMEPMAPNA